MQLFTADWHLHHKNIIRYCDRPFSDVDAMGDHFIDNLRAMWNRGDTLFFLGDMSLKKHAITQALQRFQSIGINDVVIILGNHDVKDAFDGVRNISWQSDIKNIKLRLRNGNVIQCMLCHYPMRSWNASSHGALHLHGHSHGDMAEHFNSLDVGIDNAFKLLGEYRPFTADEVYAHIQRINEKFPLQRIAER